METNYDHSILGQLREKLRYYKDNADRVQQAIDLLSRVPDINGQSPRFSEDSRLPEVVVPEKSGSEVKGEISVDKTEVDYKSQVDGSLFGGDEEYKIESLPLQERILSLLYHEKRFLHASEIAVKLKGINSGTLSSRLSKMIRNNKLRRVIYNKHLTNIFYGLDSFVTVRNGVKDFKDSSYEPIGEKTTGIDRETREFN